MNAPEVKGEKTLILLAGGKSRRMGTDKALLTHKGKTFLATIMDNFKDYDSRIIVTNDRNKHRYEGALTIEDLYEDMGPLCGIYTGLCQSKTEKNGVVTVDAPFLPSALMAHMMAISDGADVVVPKLDGRLYPLCAVYKKSIAGVLGDAMARDQRRVQDVIAGLKVRFVPKEELEVFGDPYRMLLNINTKADYEEIR